MSHLRLLCALGLLIHSTWAQYMPSKSGFAQQQQQVGGYGAQAGMSGTGNFQPQNQFADQQNPAGYNQAGGYGVGARGGQLESGASSGRGMDNGNPLNRLNPNYLGPQPNYCKRPTGQFAVANDCTKFYNCHDNIGWIQSCPEGLGFNEKTAQCDYADAVGCAAAAAATAARANQLQAQVNAMNNNNNNYGNQANPGYGSNTGLQQPNSQQTPQNQNAYSGGQLAPSGGFGGSAQQPQNQQVPSSFGVGAGGRFQPSNNQGAPTPVPMNFNSPLDLQSALGFTPSSGGYGASNLPNNVNMPPKTNWGNDGPVNAGPSANMNPGEMAVRNQPPSLQITIDPPLTPCIRPSQIPIDSIQAPNGNSIDMRPTNNNQMPNPDGDSGFPVIQPRQMGQDQMPSGAGKPPSGRPEETDSNSYSTVFGPQGPQSSRAPCQPCQEQNARCPAYPEAKCFDDVCGGCRARFFVRRSGGPSPFAEVTQLCGGNMNPAQSQSQPADPNQLQAARNTENSNMGNANAAAMQPNNGMQQNQQRYQ